jgi:hypothetical protein
LAKLNGHLPTPPEGSIGTRTFPWRGLAVRALLALLLAASFGYAGHTIRQLDMAQLGCWQTGAALRKHNVCKALLTLDFLVVLLSAGDLLLRGARRWFRLGDVRPLARIICAGYLGASALALVVFFLGFANLYSVGLAQALTFPFLVAAPFTLGDAARALAGAARRKVAAANTVQRLLGAVAAAAVLASAVVLLLNKVVYPETVDGDVWEHYLHYYREVVRTGGLWPNDVWYHFYLSKGASLFFLTMLLSDFLGAPVASYCLVVLSALVVFDLLNRRGCGTLWGTTGVVFLFLFLAPPSRDAASFFKHHIAVMAYLALALWCLLAPTGAGDEAAPRVVSRLAGALGVFYLGLYVPAGAAVLLCGLLALTAYHCLFDRRRLDFRLVAMLAAGAGLGVVLAVTINYAITGLGEIVPARLMWSHVDLDRFQRWWSRYQVEYYLLEAEPLAARGLDPLFFLKPDVGWAMRLCRSHYFVPVGLKILVLLGGAVLLTAALRETSLIAMFRACWPQTRKRLALLSGVSAYLLGVLVVALAFPGGDSLVRMYSFTALLLILGLVALASCLTGPLTARHAWAVGLALSLCIAPPLQAAREAFRGNTLQLALGKVSLGDSLRRYPFTINTSLDQFAQAQRLVPPGERQLHLSYDPGPGYLLGGRPIVTEPSYAFGGRYAELLFSPPEQARAILEELHITHVSFNVEGDLFLGLPFSPLFAAANLEEHFELVWRSGGFCLLRLTSPGAVGKRLPPDVLEALARKQNATCPRRISVCSERELYRRARARYERQTRAAARDKPGGS